MANVTPFPEPLPDDLSWRNLPNLPSQGMGNFGLGAVAGNDSADFVNPPGSLIAAPSSRQQSIALWVVAGTSVFIAVCVFVGVVFIINHFRPPPRAGASAIESAEMRKHYAEMPVTFPEFFPEPLPDKPSAPPRNPLDDLFHFSDTLPRPVVAHPHLAAYRIAPPVVHHSAVPHYFVPRESIPSATVPIGCPASLGAGCPQH